MVMNKTEDNQYVHVVITGASSGIGAALAQQYARPGVTLGLLGRNAEALQNVAAICTERGAQTRCGLVDVADANGLKDWITAFDHEYPIDLVFANAGVSSSIGPDGEAETWESVNRLINTNVQGAINTVYALLDAMRARRRGHIVLVSSLAAFYGLPLMPAYCASKAAISSYGQALRGWLRQDGIKVSVVCPGFVASRMTDQFPGPRPFIMSAAKAAELIQRGVAQNRARIVFPFWLGLGMRLLAILPPRLAELVLTTLHYGRPAPLNR